MADAIHIDFDSAWEPDIFGLPRRDMRSWGSRLRYLATKSDIQLLTAELQDEPARFILYGSGDFHHLTGVFIQRIRKPITLVSFDNHPDWDIRPPAWSCGGWINRALDLSFVTSASVWGCGNFELALPSRLFANRDKLKSGRLRINGWAERQSASTARRFDCMTRENWRERLERFADGLSGKDVYITVDLDCLRSEEAATNWENGLFTAAEVAWAIGRLRQSSSVIGGDICGAWSPSVYSRIGQRLAGWWDHPMVQTNSLDEARAVNQPTLTVLWNALTGAS